MTKKQYRVLLITSLFVGVAAGGVDLMFPQLIAEDFRQLQTAHDNALSTFRLLVFFGLAIATVILLSGVSGWLK